MREVTFQIVMRLAEADDAAVQEMERKIGSHARRQLIFTNETVSVAKLMDREVEDVRS